MGTRKAKHTAAEFSRREFLLTVGAGTPSLSLVAREALESASAPPKSGAAVASSKFTPIDLRSFFTASTRDFGPREQAWALGGDCTKDLLIRVPRGKRGLRGIPFTLGPEDLDSKGWIVLSTKSDSAAVAQVEIPLQQNAHFLCLASFCDFDENEEPGPGKDVFQQIGQRLAVVTLIYDDGTTHVAPIRRRFESNAVDEPWGHNSFAAAPPGEMHGTRLTDPLETGTDWGTLQTSLTGGMGEAPGMGILWICALENPQPDRTIKAVRLEAAGEDSLVVCGLTLFQRPENPLRFEPRNLYRVTLAEVGVSEAKRWRVEIDLGWHGRTFTLPDFQPDAWLASPAVGLGEVARYDPNACHLYIEFTANATATLTLHDTKTGKRYTFELAKVFAGGEAEASEGGGHIEIAEPGHRWVHGRVVDPDTKKPTPVRLAFRSKEGRYIPPYGHRAEINDGWFQDYGADVKLNDTSFAYVDGTFQVELPTGEVYLEMTKGFEYQAVRRKLEIQPGQRELTVEIPRLTNLRAQGWVTADTHTHFLSPTTGVLEAQAEGLNLINLLAAQWGDLFTNVGDIPFGPVVSQDRETMVWVGSENRQHLLGHIGLEGIRGKPVFPMSADGPSESLLGEPLWTSLAEWAETCRQQKGLAVAVHFPYPTGEIAADIILGKIDAVEIWPRDEPTMHPKTIEQFDNLRYLDWYHYLNCGYRLPAVGGTDKMGANIPVGTNRVYAYLGREEFNFPNFAKAVRAGNTFATTGPLLIFQADGQPPGAEITLATGGGTIEVSAEAQCFVPFHRLEVVYNGKVVASREESAGAQAMHLSEKIKLPGPGWLAARCASQLGPTTTWHLKIAAHTSPVYVRVPGRELFSPEAASYFLRLIDGSQLYVETLATRPDPDTFAKIRKVFTDARGMLHRRMHQHGIPH
jgi:hypothetical protein